MNDDFASHTPMNVFWKPKTGVQEQLWGEASQAGGQGWWPFPTQFHPTAPIQKSREGTGMVNRVSHSQGMAKQACSYGQVQGDAMEGQGGDGTWPGTGIAVTWHGEGQQPEPRFCCTVPGLALSTATNPWVRRRGCGTCQCLQGSVSSFISPHFKSQPVSYLKWR